MIPIKLAFATCFRDHVPGFLDRFSEVVAPNVELWVVSEFPPARGKWIPYRITATPKENLKAIREAIDGYRVLFCALSMQPGAPYGDLRWLAVRIGRGRTLVFNENYDHFALRPSSWRPILRYVGWKTREYVVWQTHPGGDLYTFLWRLRHPREFARPRARFRALRAGRAIAKKKRVAPISERADSAFTGISIVIPSRDGRELLATLLPNLETTDVGEILIVDNGSTDGTAAFLKTDHPNVRVDIHEQPLSFAHAVNRGIELARYSHVLLLNNDMLPHSTFLEPLANAFHRNPDLFCATSQIFFPEGKRREETGKAVMAGRADHHQFPVECVEPIEGEDGSPVLYGSGGCSLYSVEKLKALGGFCKIYEPAYVEDLDIGFRAWQRGWATVFSAQSRVTHHHRATTSRFFTSAELDFITERNYLRFLARTVGSPGVFTRLWSAAIERLNWKAAIEHHEPSMRALVAAPEAERYIEVAPACDEEQILATGSGDIAVFPGYQTPKGPTILLATAYNPFPLSHGGAVRMFNLMRRAANDFTQVLLTFVDELHTPAPELLEVFTEIVQVRRVGTHLKPDRGRPEVVEDFDRLAFHGALEFTLRKWKPAIVQLEFTQMAQYAAECSPAKTVLVEHDITIDLYRQLLETRRDPATQRELDRWQSFETKAWESVDCVIVMSEKDRAEVKRAPRIIALPNGVDLERFQPSSDPPDPGRLLFIGSFQHLPNLLALDFFLREIWPALQGTTLHVIAGADYISHYERFRDRVQMRLETSGVHIDGFTPDVRPAYRKAAVVIAPLLASAGTNIKILEAMAMGKPIVSTPAGVNGLDLSPGVDVLVTSDPALFTEHIKHLLNSPEHREEIGRQARRTVEQRFDWDEIARKQREMYQDLVKS